MIRNSGTTIIVIIKLLSSCDLAGTLLPFIPNSNRQMLLSSSSASLSLFVVIVVVVLYDAGAPTRTVNYWIVGAASATLAILTFL